MGKKERQVQGKNIRHALLSSPGHFIQEVTGSYQGLEFTKAVDTFIMENIRERPLRIELRREGKNLLAANLLWASEDEITHEVILYLDNKTYLYPKPENLVSAMIYPSKTGQAIVVIETHSRSPPCLICGNPLEIFDDATATPCCGTPAHKVHLDEWVRMKSTCSSCNASLTFNSAGEIIVA